MYKLIRALEEADEYTRREHRRHIAEDCNSIPLFSEDDGSVL